jgi:anti-sigma factor RsiW
MNNDETKLLQAYVDGELDPANAVALEARLAQNARLRSQYEWLRDMSAAVRDKAAYHAAPQALAARIRSSLADGRPEPAPRKPRFFDLPWLRPMAALAAAMALGLGVGAVFTGPSESELLAREVVASHVRATLSERIIEVASSDQHTVKPWLSDRLPFSPRVTDFSGEGFPLVGARLDYIDGKPAAVLVYKRRRHTIDLFVWPGKPVSSAAAERNGFNIEPFSAGGLQYWAVSDLNRKELEDFIRLASGRQ